MAEAVEQRQGFAATEPQYVERMVRFTTDERGRVSDVTLIKPMEASHNEIAAKPWPERNVFLKQISASTSAKTAKLAGS